MLDLIQFVVDRIAVARRRESACCALVCLGCGSRRPPAHGAQLSIPDSLCAALHWSWWWHPPGEGPSSAHCCLCWLDPTTPTRAATILG